MAEVQVQGVDGPADVSMLSHAQPIESVAVLPFVNVSADPDNEYFSDGVTEEVLNVLKRA